MPDRTIGYALRTVAECWQAETHPAARLALYEALIRCLPPATCELLSIVAATAGNGFAWREHGMASHEHIGAMLRLKALGLVRSQGTGLGARWYAVGAMERP